MHAPLTPADCDLRDFPRMMIDIPRLFSSEFDATVTDSAWRYGVTLWLKSFHQVPAASLPDDDVLLAKLAGLGRDTRAWKRARGDALRGWVKCGDGRLYHPVIAEIALECWLEKLAQRLAGGSGNATRWSVEFDPAPIQAEIAACATMLQGLNPKSKALTKKAVVTAVKAAPKPSPGVGVGSQPDRNPIAEGSQEKRSEGKGLDTPQPPDGGLDHQAEAKRAYPRQDQRPDQVARDWVIACEAVDPARLVEAVRRYAASDEAKFGGGRQVPHLDKWLRERRYEPWLPADEVTSGAAWSGPADLFAAVVSAKGADWAAGYLGTCRWVDLPERGVVPRSKVYGDRLEREVGAILGGFNVAVLREEAA